VPELPSFEPYLRRLRQRGGADVLLLAGTAATAQRILPTLDTVGLEARVLGGDGLSGLETQRRAEGVFMTAAYLPDLPGERNAAFVAAYRAAYPGQSLDHRGAAAYDVVYLLARGLEAVGADRRRLRDYLAGVGRASPPYRGVTGTIAFDELGDVPGKEVVLGVVRDGQLVVAPH
jgi:branched-chain amino acid transport system substrate-binding protein